MSIRRSADTYHGRNSWSLFTICKNSFTTPSLHIFIDYFSLNFIVSDINSKLTSFGYTSIYFCCLFVSLITSVCNLKVARQTLHHSLPRTVLQLRVTRSWPTSLSVETNSIPHLALFHQILVPGGRDFDLWRYKVAWCFQFCLNLYIASMNMLW